jgi:hypothetical protein
MHGFPVGAAVQDDGKLASGVFVGGSLPAQSAEAPATKTSATAEAITTGRIARGTRPNLQSGSEVARRSASALDQSVAKRNDAVVAQRRIDGRS